MGGKAPADMSGEPARIQYPAADDLESIRKEHWDVPVDPQPEFNFDQTDFDQTVSW